MCAQKTMASTGAGMPQHEGIKPPMDILIAPISGGGFPSQIAASLFLISGGYRPRIAMGGSGGAVTEYLMELGEWNEGKVRAIMQTLDSNLFVTKPTIPLLGSVLSILRGSLFQRSPIGQSYLRMLMDKVLPYYCEIWTGSQDSDHQRPVYTCNLDKSRSIITLDSRDIRDMNLYPPIYCGTDTELLSKYVTSTFSIPSVLPSTIAGGRRLSDPGMVYGSPIHSFRRAIVRMAKEKSVTLHLTILTTVDLYEDREYSLYNGQPAVLMTLINQALGAIHSNVGKDRLSCMDIMWFQGLRVCGVVTFKATPEALHRLNGLKLKSPGTVTEVFSTKHDPVNLTTFTSSRLLESVTCVGEKLMMRLRWFEQSLTGNLFNYQCAHEYRPVKDENLSWIIQNCEDVVYYDECNKS